MPVLHFDIESKSALDIKKVGAAVYAEHPTTDAWLLCWAVDDGEVLTWHPGDPPPDGFIEAARNPDWTIGAHNSSFERGFWERILTPRHGFPPVPPIERWRCTMAQSLACSLPGKLEKVADALSLEFRKDAEGHRLMLKMAKPRKPRKGEDPNVLHWNDEPEKLVRLGAYCKRDVEVERELHHRLPPLSDAEQSLWVLDAAINARGFHVDGALLDAASRIAATVDRAMQDELARITDGVVTSTDQVGALQAWLAGRGCDVKDMQKDTLKAALRRRDLDAVARRAIELRRDAAFDTKVDTMLAHRGADGRIRGTLQYHGAGTGRWAARGVQVQNFTRDPGERRRKGRGDHGQRSLVDTRSRSGAIADAARGAICAAPGHRFLIGDFSGVESRVLAWIAGETTKLDQWRTFDATGDPRDEPYFILGKACGMPDETARHGKFVDLAFGYMGGIAAYAGTTYEGDPSTDAEREQFKATWRQLHPRTMAFWYAVDGAAIEAVRTPGKVQSGHGLRFQCADDFLKLKLPSGRIVRYPFPRIGKSKFGKPCVIFKDTALGKWSDCHYGLGAYGGLWTENIVQAIARDLMAAAMMRLEAAGYACVLTVHDEIIAEVPDGAGSLDEFHRLLVAAVAWAEGLPIAAKVREGQRYSRPAAVGDASAISPISVDDAASVETDADDITLATSDDAGDAVDDAATSIQGSDADDEAPPWVATDMPEPDGTAEAPPESPGEDGPDISLVDLPSAEHVVLVDGSTYIHRAYHVAHREAAPLFRRMLQKTLRELGAGASAPTHLAVIFDAPGPTFRNDIYPEYKANRPPVPEELSSQLPRMREVVRALGLPCIEQAGVEADDVIATYTRQASGAVTIVASDKDLMQLVTDRVTMYEPMKERRIGIAEVTEKFGVPPERVADVQALAGDATDNVPGVPGIGVKTAAQLIRTYGDLETLLGRAGEIGQPKVRQALIENAEQARLSLQLVLLDDTVALDVPLDAIAVTLDALDTRQAADPVATPDADTPEPARAEGLAEPTGNDANADDDPGDVYPGDSDGPTGTGHGERDTGRQVAFYVYKHADGSPYLGVKRTSTKQFPQYHLNGAKWEKGAPAGLRIPYRLPELIKAKRDRWVLICAGEKDANSAAALGFVATCNPEGEKKGAWVPELNTWFAGRPRVAIMEDNDKTGQAHAIEVANALRGIVPEIRIVGFRELPEHGDLTDWIEQGHGAKDLRAWIEAARPFYSKPRMAPIGEWDGKPVPRPEYTVPDRIPARQVFLFSGEGGEGKSIMLQQLCAAHSLGATWLGCTVRQGPAIYLECEDAEEILHWRLAAIAEHYGASFKDLAAAGLRMCSMIEHDSILAATGRNGIVEPTAAYDWLYELAGDTKPVLIGIASTSNTFAGNENNRSEVQQFAKLLTRIALVTGGSVALVTHPSMTGVTSNVASHEGLSGTTQWHNAVRARAVMKKVKVNGEDESDVAENRVREIKFHKNQYGPPVASSFVRWQHGMFLPVDGVHSMGAVERAAKADRVFIALLRRWTEQNRTVSAKVNPSNYAPTAFARQPEATGLTARDFTAAMERLLRDKLIENRMSVSSSGKRSRGHLAVVEGGAHA